MDIIKLDDSNKTKIKAAISQQLATILGQEEEEDVLPEYVMVMIANQKTKDQVRADLEAFLGDQSAAFTAWLWDMLSTAKNATTAGARQESQAMASTQRREERTQPMTSMEVDRNSRGSRDTHNITDHTDEPPKSAFASVITVPTPPKRHELENPAPSRLVLNAVSEAVKSVPKPGDRTSTDFSERRYRTGKRAANVFGRLGEKGSDGKSDKFNDRTGERDKFAMREEPVMFTITLNAAPPEEQRGSGKRRSMESAGAKVKENDDADMEDAAVDTELEGDEGTKKIKKQKCQFWPNCKRGDECVYVHPTTQCNLFPACPYGENCLFIHPAVPCKFGTSCTRVGCVYNHPAGTAASTTQKGGVPCKHGFACPREGCTFAHPPEACRYGESCTRTNCHFGHGKACRFGVTCANPGCSFTHYKDINKPCKFGAACTNASCKFQHNSTKDDNDMVEASISGLSATLPPTPPREGVVAL
jgi:hypothetical protein